MISFSAGFAAQAASNFSRQFWTLVIHFPTGDQYFADYPWTVNGNTHKAIVTQWGEIGSLANREEKILDVSSVTIEVTNLPVLPSSARMSDLLTGNIETVQATVYCNFIDSATNIFQEVVYLGVIDSPIAYDYQTATITLLSVGEYYLNRPALRQLDRGDFPSIRDSDNGSTVPIAWGVVPRTPGRVLKGSNVTIPVPDAFNTSSAQLLSVDARTGALTENWQVIFAGDASAKFDGPFDGESSLALGGSFPAVGTTDSITTGAGTASSLSKSVTLASSTTIMLVGVHMNAVTGNVPVVTAVTYNAIACEAIASPNSHSNFTATQGCTFALYYMAAPPTGAAHTLQVTLNLTVAFCVTVVGLNNAAFGFGASLLTSGQLASNSHQSQISQTMPTNPNENLMVDFFTRSHATAGPTPLGGQTTQVTASASGGSGVFGGVSSKTATTASTSMGWNTNSTTDQEILVLVPAFRQIDVYAQSFTLASAQQIVAAKARIRRNPASPLTSYPINAYIYSNASGQPGSGTASNLGHAQSSLSASATGTFLNLVFSAPVGVPSGTYWLVLTGLGPATGGVAEALWSKSSTGGFSGGNAQRGKLLTFVNGPEWSWSGGMSGQDFVFSLQFHNNTYSVYGSVSGFDGTGSIDTDFISSSNRIGISANDWSGTPAGGDKFYFGVDNSNSRVLLCESPTATPIQSIDTIWWGDNKIGDASILTSDGSSDADFLLGNSDQEIFAQGFTVISGILLKGVKLWLGQSGSPTGNLTMRISPSRGGPALVPGVFSKVYGTLPTNESIVSLELPPANIATSTSEIDRDFLEPIVLAPGRYFLELLADAGTSTTNCYKVGMVTAGTQAVATEVNLQRDATGRWFDFSAVNQIKFELTAVTVTKNTSIADETGTYIAEITFNVPIPDSINISAGVHGITSSGTLLVRPDQVMHWLLNYWGISDASLDIASFNASGALYPTYRFDGVAQESGSRKELVLQLAFESRSAFDWGRLVTWRWLPLELTSSDLTVGMADIVLTGKLPLINVKRTDTTKLVNFLDLRYQRRAIESRSLTSYDRIVNAQAPDSIDGVAPDAGYGNRENPELFMMDFLRDGAMADDVATYYCSRLAFPRNVVEVTTKLHLLRVEKDDSLSFNIQ